MILAQDPETGYWNRFRDRPDLVLRTHARTEDCDQFGCDIHNRIFNTDKPLNWRSDRGMMEFICECGIGHPTVHQTNYWLRTIPFGEARAQSVHGCCGCRMEGGAKNNEQD